MKKIGLFIGLLLIVFTLFFIQSVYRKVYSPNVFLEDKEFTYLYIPSGASYSKVVSIIAEQNILKDIKSFNWLATKKHYPELVKAGRFKIKNQLNNNELINLLRSGKQDPVKLTFNNVRSLEILAGRVAKQIEADSTELIGLLNNTEVQKNYGFTSETFMSMFLPNTYFFFWNTGSERFIERMHQEYIKFWTKERKEKAASINLNPVKVSILASIIDEETNKNEEKKRIAGVYINRLQKGYRLQADPTVKFALGDFSIRRVLNDHLEINSPYNTYKFRGLPPGPIRIPSITSIEAVLNYERHEYMYFCAKEDFSGYHVFARTLTQHNKNARAYRRALDKEKIWE